MPQRTAVAVCFFLLVLHISCEHLNTTEYGQADIQTSSSSSASIETTSTIQDQPTGHSDTYHTQMPSHIVTQQPGESSSVDSAETLTNQVTDATVARSTAWTTLQTELSTSQQTDLSLEGSTGESTTQSPKEESTEGVHVASTDFSTYTSTKKFSNKPTIDATYQSTTVIAQSSTECCTQQESADTSSTQFVSSAFTETPESYTPETATDISTGQTTQPAIEEPTELVTAPQLIQQSTDVQNTISDTEQPIVKYSTVGLASSTQPQNETVAAANDESSDDWKIAVGVIIPLLLLIVTLVGVYICYRKKYPVRMIIGREFGKFSNPNYSRREHAPSLIREDAEFFFSSNKTSSTVPTQEFNPVNKKIMYDNMGFVKDDNIDEDEKERKFMQSKSWLFRNTSHESETTVEEDTEITVESSFIANSSSDAAAKLEANRNETKTSAATTHPVTLVADETKPIVKPRRKKRAPEAPGNRQPVSQLNDQPSGSPATLYVTSETRSEVPKVIGSSLPRNFGFPGFNEKEHLNDTNGNTEVTRDIQNGVQQATFNQEVKERSQSLSLDRTEFHGRPRSYSVDPAKSCRKTSLYDEIVEATRLKFLEAQRKKASISEEVSKVTAFVVGVDIRDRDAAVTSSVLIDDDDKVHNDNALGTSWKQSYPVSKSTASNTNVYSHVPGEGQNAKGTNSEDIRSQQRSTINHYDVNIFADDSHVSANSDTDHQAVAKFLLSDNENVEEKNDSKNISGSKMQDTIINPDMAFVSSSSSVLKDNSYQDDTDSALPDTWHSTNNEPNQVSVLDRSISATSGSSSSSADHEDMTPDCSNAAVASELEVSVISSTDVDAIIAETEGRAKNTVNNLRSEFGNEQTEQENDAPPDNVSDVNGDTNTSPASDRRRKFKLISPEMKYSRSSTESLVGSSESSRSVPSDDEEEDETGMEFSSSLQIPNQYKDNASNTELVVRSVSGITRPFSYLHGDDHVSPATLPTPDGGGHTRTAVFELHYSDSSSDSSDILPRKAINLLSRQPGNSDSGMHRERKTHSPKDIRVNEDYIEATSKEQSEDCNNDDLGATYKLRDYNDDDDVDV